MNTITTCFLYFVEKLFELVALCEILIGYMTFDIVGKFPEDEDISEDFKWMLQACLLKIPFVGIHDNQHRKRKNPESVTAKNIDVIAENTARIRREILNIS